MKAWIRSALALAFSGACVAAQAQTFGSLAAGTSLLRAECTAGNLCDNSGTGTRLVLGHFFAPFFAGELAYQRFGSARIGSDAAVGQLKSRGFSAGLAAHWPMGANWAGSGRVGLLQMAGHFKGTEAGTTGEVSYRETAAVPYVGLSASWRMSPRDSVDLGYLFTKTRLSVQGVRVDHNIGLISLGLTVGF